MTPLPPHGRIFGLGLSKTGTSSLAEALTILGFPAVHYPWDETTVAQLERGDCRLHVLEEQYRAATDIPIAPFYRGFDQAWPDSRFILTVRDTEPWLRSVEQHWRLLVQWWDSHPRFRQVQEFVSQAAYGSVAFDRERFRAAYDAHVAGVLAWFRQRPADLLVLDICGGEGWERLCPFLGVPVPDRPFPHANEWMHRLLAAAAEIRRLVPPGATFLLVDEYGFGADVVPDRRQLPFPERDGTWLGRPADDATAIAELERARALGAAYVVVGWPAFWWLDHYAGWARRLAELADQVTRHPDVVVYRLPPA